MNKFMQRRRLLSGRSKFWVINKNMPGVLINGTFEVRQRGYQALVSNDGVYLQGNNGSLGGMYNAEGAITGIDFTKYETLNFKVLYFSSSTYDESKGGVGYGGNARRSYVSRVGLYQLNIKNVSGIQEINIIGPGYREYSMTVSEIWLE